MSRPAYSSYNVMLRVNRESSAWNIFPIVKLQGGSKMRGRINNLRSVLPRTFPLKYTVGNNLITRPIKIIFRSISIFKQITSEESRLRTSEK